MRKFRLVLLGIATGIGVAVPVHAQPTEAADPTGDDSAFLAELQKAGIAYPDDNGAVEAGKTVCRLANHGETALQVLNDLRAADPALTLHGAAMFVTIAARTYCPHQLDALDS
ncbi:DUF732 domain-containing protein [Mycolicibacter heraklionensis]|uniref:DUF732 domain-containing protein n=1 Tax=Mycolicibacter heraklionensis TaxID=512402 RepID=UPI0007EA6E59|nr:DUF732 domain-containing protein [Mycolicibacter heraklionensis]OBG30820.1 hypothetical protein A5671_11100 [Mycolicibacter heraklionensis]OBJ32031.1 hypothetical protein A5631_09745 [Mycolicibacter heraklionensis]